MFTSTTTSPNAHSHAVLEISAAPEQTWAVATDMSRYGEWNVTHTGFPEGSPAAEPGATFKATNTIAVSFDGGPLAGPLGDTVAESAEKGLLESLERLKGLVG